MKKQQKKTKRKQTKKIKYYCPECNKPLKTNNYDDGYRACFYCGLVLFKPKYDIIDNIVIPDLKEKKE